MATNENVNKVIYGNQTVMDITDTTAEESDVASGEVFYKANGARSVGTLNADSAIWGQITGDIDDQSDLQTEIAKKVIRLTQTEYNALSSAEKHDAKKVYYIYDYSPAPITLINDGVVSLTSTWSSNKLSSDLDDKVDKVSGKGLSTNDFTSAEKTKLAGLHNYDDTEIRSIIPTATSQLTNNSGFITSSDVPSRTSDLTNDSNFIADASYVHTDNNYDATAKAVVDGATAAIAAKSTVAWNQIDTTGTKIAEITIDGVKTDVKATGGGGSADAYKTIDAAGQSFVANGADTFKINAGSNVTITPLMGDKGIQISASGGGMLPYLYIDSEAGATVTVVQPDSTTITPTAAGSGHWECELTGGYGTYVIHSVLSGQGDATLSLAVDTVKEYHITDTHYDYTINVTAPSGSSVRITGGGETYTGTGTGSSQAFAVHTPSTTYTVAVTMDGNTKSETITSAATSGQSGSVTIAFGTINLTYANDFRGKTITCTKSGVTVTKTAPSSGNTMTFRVPTTGTWTISGVVSGQTYSVDAVVSSLTTAVSVNLQTTPEGSTVLPTDDIPTWLACGGLSSTGYTTLSQVLADSTTLLALISDNNAVDYLVRSTTWATDICTNSTAMTDIGANNYAADTLLANADWLDAIANSTYFESVLNAKVPTLSSESANATASRANTGYEAYHAFHDQDSALGTQNHGWSVPTPVAVGDYVQYMFTEAVAVKKVLIGWLVIYGTKVKIRGSNNGTSWTDLTSNITLEASSGYDNSKSKTLNINNNTKYNYYRLEHTLGIQSNGYGFKLQLYGREDV